MLANKEWSGLFPNAEVPVTDLYTSDHCALNLSRKYNNFRSRYRRVREFKFEPMWFKENSFKQFVRSSWVEIQTEGGTFTDKLKKCSSKLMVWNNTVFGNVHKNIKTLKNQLKCLKEQYRTDEVILKESKANSDLDEWLAREELVRNRLLI